jgi:hypothetical protein
MSFINPFVHNPRYQQLFQIRSDISRCEIQEVVELYRNLQEDYYVLFRYQCTNNMMPIRMSHKFTNALSLEVKDNGNETSLLLTTTYKDFLTVFEKINICCGSKTYVLKVEQELYNALF